MNNIVLCKVRLTIISHITLNEIILMLSMMLSIGEMHQHSIQHHASPDDPDSFISLRLILLCGLV